MEPISANFVSKQKNTFLELDFYQEVAYVSFFHQSSKKNYLKGFKEKSGKLVETSYLLGDYSIGSKVHEYGGGSFCLGDDFCFFVNHQDQQIYTYSLKEDQNITPLTNHRDCSFADLYYCSKIKTLFAVCEKKTEKKNILCVIAYHLPSKKIATLLTGRDCYSSICFCTHTQKIAWLEWDYPNMPWDECELWVGFFDIDLYITQKKKISFAQESVFQPAFSSTNFFLKNQLFFVNDKSNWWNLYVWNGEKRQNCLPIIAEFASVQWVFGLSSYGFLNSKQIACCYLQDAYWYFAILDITSQTKCIIKKFSNIQYLKAENEKVVFLASEPNQDLDLYYYDATKNNLQKTKKKKNTSVIIPESVYFTNSFGVIIQSFFYQSTGKELIVKPHGGPTAFSDSGLDWAVQYWLSRGYSYLDINYRGSSGFGRDFRNILYGNWGNYDVADIVEAVDWLLHYRTKKYFQSIILKGSSAGGFSILCALSHKKHPFTGAICYYPVTEPNKLLQNTHDFEFGYLKNLLGKKNLNKKFWDPVSIKTPLLFLQGSADKIVPASGVQKVVKILQKNGTPCDFHLFSREGHGFQMPNNIAKALLLEENFIN